MRYFIWHNARFYFSTFLISTFFISNVFFVSVLFLFLPRFANFFTRYFNSLFCYLNCWLNVYQLFWFYLRYKFMVFPLSRNSLTSSTSRPLSGFLTFFNLFPSIKHNIKFSLFVCLYSINVKTAKLIKPIFCGNSGVFSLG